MPDTIRSALIEFSLRDNNIVASLNAMSGAGDNALDVMRNLSIATSEEYNQAVLEAMSSTSGFGGALEDTGSESKSLAEKIGALSGSFATFGYNINTVMNWLDRYEISQLNVESATNRLENAQMRYNEVLKKYGENSEDTKQASNELQNAQNALDKANLRANSSMMLIGISMISMTPQILKAGQALITFARTGTIVIAEQTYTVNANTISHAANSTAKWIGAGAQAVLTALTSKDTYITAYNTIAKGALAVATGALAVANWLLAPSLWAVAVPLGVIELPLWAVIAGIAALILVIDDLWTYLSGGESVIGDFLNWLTNIDFSSVIDTFLNAGKFLLDALLRGMTFGLIGTDTLKNIFGIIDKYLPHSNAKAGPLSNLTLSGQRLVETFGLGAESKKGYLSSVMGGILKLPEVALDFAKPMMPSLDGLLKIPEVALDFISPMRGQPLINPLVNQPQMSLPALTIPATGNADAAPISVSVTITGNTISGDEKSLKTMAVTTATEIEKVMMKLLNQQASRA